MKLVMRTCGPDEREQTCYITGSFTVLTLRLVLLCDQLKIELVHHEVGKKKPVRTQRNIRHTTRTTMERGCGMISGTLK
jgi:hypothetical protein